MSDHFGEGGALPFTGLALGALLLVAAIAIATGVAMRRVSGNELDAAGVREGIQHR